MEESVLRRNRRRTRKALVPRSHLALLALSAFALLCSMVSFAWVTRAQGDPPGPTAVPDMIEQNAHDLYPGKIMTASPEEEPDGIPAASGEASSTPSQDAAAEEDAPSTASNEDDDVHARTAPAFEQADPSPSEPAAAPPAQEHRLRVIHHTAYEREEVYRTVHHQASVAKESVVDGVARIEWTSCPVCGQRHSDAYNERILDHVNERLCQACGKRHAAGFDETVQG